jgi:activator of HSP90 ATPase
MKGGMSCIYSVSLICRVSAFTQGPAQIVPKAGGAFNMFGGAVSGEIITIETNKKIEQKWRFNTWPEDHFSQVTLEFEEQFGKTKLTLTQSGTKFNLRKLTPVGVPSNDFDRTKTGWEEFFWKRIRGLFGWSYKLQ